MQENDYPYINLNINGEKRWAHAGWDPEKQQYWSLLPAKNLQDSAYPAGDGTEPDVQGHLATFDKDGKLLGVQAMHWGVEGGLDGFYPTQWPTKADSIYNANAAKTYSTQVFKQVPRQENGGNMNYYQYLQEGGAAEDQMGQVVSQVIAALKQNPEETLKKLREMGEQGEQLFEMAVQSDPELQEMFSQSMKCGGKVRPKVKKAKCGKKLQEGDKIKKVSTGCSCQLKKVGGRLIEVDSCTGMPIHRDGGVMKFQPGGIMKFKNPSGVITTTSSWYGNSFSFDPNTNEITYESLDSNGPKKMTWQEINKQKNAKQFFKDLYDAGYDNINGYQINNQGLWTTSDKRFTKGVLPINSGYDKYTYDNGKYTQQGRDWSNDLSFQDLYQRALRDPKIMRWLVQHNNVGYRGNEIDYKGGKAQWDTSKMKYVYKKPATATEQPSTNYTIGQVGTGTNAGKVWNGNTWANQTYGQINAARAGMTNADGTGWDVAKRKEWMNSDEGKAYLASINNGQGLGFTADQYTGSAAQNRALFGAYKGFANWKANRQATAANKSATGAGNETAVDPATVKTTTYMQNPKTNFQDSTNMTNQQLLNLNAAQALATLDSAGYKRWMQLNSAKNQDTYQIPTTGMTLDGKTYTNQNDYTSAANAYNNNLIQKQQAELSGVKSNIQRRKIMDKYNSMFAPKWNEKSKVVAQRLTPDILSATTFAPTASNKFGGSLNYSNYLKQ